VARRQRNKPTDAERDARRNEDRERFEEAVSALLSSNGWERWMRTRRCFRTYSVNNQLLVALQRPQATRVAGFRAWLSLNRCVRKGERGIRIFAPMPVRERDAEGAVVVDPETGRPQSRTLFKSVAVFDVEQTEPLPDTEPVPLEPPSRPITGDSHRELLPRLEALAEELAYAVEFRDLENDPCDGWCDAPGGLIVVGSHLTANAQVRVLVHELAHALGIGYEEFGRERAEVLVDCATYLVLQTAGLDVSGESVPYVASWGEDGALEAVQAFAERIDEVARRIEDALADDQARHDDRTAGRHSAELVKA
jgi:hypothetical protein